MESLHSELETGISHYPIIYVPHFHQRLIYDEIKHICKKINGTKGSKMIQKIECAYESVLSNASNNYYSYCKDIVNKLSKSLNSIYCGLSSTEILIINNVTNDLLNDSSLSSLLYEFAEYYEREYEKISQYLTIVLCVPSCELPPQNITGISYVVNVHPPTTEEIGAEIERFEMKGLSDDNSYKTRYIRALQGLQLFDVIQIIQSTKNKFCDRIANNSIKWAQKQKQQIVRKTGILEVIEPDVNLNDVGGLKNLIEKVKGIARVYKRIDLLQNGGVPLPKGFLLLGMPGCGKSMIAKATAKEFDCPLIKLDMGRLLGKYVGDSEHNLQIALDVVDSAHPCVLWIDEIEKAFAGTNNSSGDGDAVMMRLMGKFLSWMQERKTAVFIMATANDVLKPELMRKGRFDEVFFVDFPSSDEVETIILKTVEKYSNSIRNHLINLFITKNHGEKEEYSFLADVAKRMTDIMDVQKDNKGHSIRRGLSGAEIKSAIDTFVVDTISDGIESAEKKRIQIDINEISFDREKFNKVVNRVIDSAMIRQKSEGKNGDGGISFIDKIYAFKKKYQFQSAS